MRDDVAALVAAWDKKTTKKAKSYGGLLDDLGGVLGEDRAIALAPAVAKDPEGYAGAKWGILCLSDRRLIFLGRNGQARFDLADIAELNIYAGGGESFLVSMMTGGMIQVRVGADESFFEIETNSATGPFWTALQNQWASEKDAAKHRQPAAHPSPQASSVADELAKLADLRSQGILTEDEFAAQKQRLLSS